MEQLTNRMKAVCKWRFSVVQVMVIPRAWIKTTGLSSWRYFSSHPKGLFSSNQLVRSFRLISCSLFCAAVLWHEKLGCCEFWLVQHDQLKRSFPNFKNKPLKSLYFLIFPGTVGIYEHGCKQQLKHETNNEVQGGNKLSLYCAILTEIQNKPNNLSEQA